MGNCCNNGASRNEVYFNPHEIRNKMFCIVEFSEITECEDNKGEIKSGNKGLEVVHPCIICFENESCSLLLPCKHSKLCAKCALYFKKLNQCPICKTEINKVVRIFWTQKIALNTIFFYSELKNLPLKEQVWTLGLTAFGDWATWFK